LINVFVGIGCLGNNVIEVETQTLRHLDYLLRGLSLVLFILEGMLPRWVQGVDDYETSSWVLVRLEWDVYADATKPRTKYVIAVGIENSLGPIFLEKGVKVKIHRCL
jgi:hypothetical protein